MLLVALPPPALADELPKAAQELIDESGVSAADAAGWTLTDVLDRLGEWAVSGFRCSGGRGEGRMAHLVPSTPEV